MIAGGGGHLPWPISHAPLCHHYYYYFKIMESKPLISGMFFIFLLPYYYYYIYYYFQVMAIILMAMLRLLRTRPNHHNRLVAITLHSNLLINQLWYYSALDWCNKCVVNCWLLLLGRARSHNTSGYNIGPTRLHSASYNSYRLLFPTGLACSVFCQKSMSNATLMCVCV